MKPKQLKYEEAVERNLGSAQRSREIWHLMHDAEVRFPFEGMHLEAAKMRLGIRKDDHRHDDAVRKLTKRMGKKGEGVSDE